MPNQPRSSAGVALVAAIPVALGLGATAIDSEAGGAVVSPETVEMAFESGPIVASDTPQGHLNVYFGNLHAHTSYSDGVEEPSDAYRHARDAGGLDFMAITEHNHSSAGQIANDHSLYSGSDADSLISTANRFTVDGEFVALYGQEYSSISRGNHVNVLDVPRVIDVPNGAYDQLVEDWLPDNPDSTGGARGSSPRRLRALYSTSLLNPTSCMIHHDRRKVASSITMVIALENPR